MDSKLHLQDDEKDAGNDSCDPSLRLDTYDNGPAQPQPNPQQYPPISSHGSSQYFHPSFPQVYLTTLYFYIYIYKALCRVSFLKGTQESIIPEIFTYIYIYL